MRVEEVEDSHDDEDGVDVDTRAVGRRFASDELHFTGIDMGAGRTRRRRTKNAYDEDSDDSDMSTEGEYGAGPSNEYGQNMQLMLREKEDLLVEQALERMRRARELGKTNVKLTRAQIDALERAERRQRLAAPPAKAPKSKKPAQTRPKMVEKKSSKSDRSSGNSPSMKTIEPRRRGKSSTGTREAAPLPYPVLPDEPYGVGSGALMYAPQGYYGPPAAPVGYYGQPAAQPLSTASRPGSRTASSQSLRQQQSHTPPLPQYQHPYQQGRYYSNPDAYQTRPPPDRAVTYPRPDPADPNWEPRARSSSSLVSYPIDRYESAAYSSQAPAPLRFDPNDPRFASPQARRVASGPPDMYLSQAPGHHPPQDGLVQPGNGASATEGDDDEDSDDDAGVQVNVTEGPGGSYGVQTRASANTAAGNRGKGGGQVKRGTARRTR
jgi:hypothetical protein